MTTLILLAGGLGTRFGSPIPKQYLPLQDKPLALHSYDLFKSSPLITEIVIVCDPAYQHIFPNHTLFADPGPTRQKSVYSGLLQSTQELILTHDAARPFFELKYLLPLLEAIRRTGAAAVGSPLTSTIKQVNASRLIERTLDRSTLWEIQSPQGALRDIFFKAHSQTIETTDDLSLIEAMGHPAEIVPCSPRNFKITTPFDLTLANFLCATN